MREKIECKNCGKPKEEHIEDRWCYKCIEGIASSADWEEYVED